MTFTRTCAYAWALFLATTLASVTCYSYLRKSHAGRGQFIPSVKLGETAYRIGGSDHCSGLLTLKVTNEKKELSISGEGVIRAAFAGATIPLTIRTQADFNALRQLGGAFFSIASDNGYAVISLFNIHPIKVDIRIRSKEINRDFSTTIPGPIVARTLPNSEISIQAKIDREASRYLEAGSQQPILQRLRLNETNDDTEKNECRSAQGAAIELDSSLHFIQAIANIFPAGLLQ